MLNLSVVADYPFNSIIWEFLRVCSWIQYGSGIDMIFFLLGKKNDIWSSSGILTAVWGKDDGPHFPDGNLSPACWPCFWLYKESVAEAGQLMSHLPDPYPFFVITTACLCYMCPEYLPGWAVLDHTEPLWATGVRWARESPGGILGITPAPYWISY